MKQYNSSGHARVMMHLIFGPLLAVWLHSAVVVHSDFFVVAALWSAAYAAVLWWLHTIKMIVTDEELIFVAGISRDSVRIDSIEDIRLGFELSPYGSPFRLIVTARGHDEPIRINAKVFSREALEAVLRLKGPLLPDEERILRKGYVAKALRSPRTKSQRSRKD